MKIAVIINKDCRNYKKNKDLIKEFENNISCDKFIIKAKDLVSTLKKIQIYPIVIIGGGDGTIHTTVQHIKPEQVLGVLPIGTLNHFIKDAHLPQTVQELIESIKANRIKNIDLVSINNEKVINNISLGFYPYFVKKRERLEKSIGKLFAYIPAFFHHLRKHKPLTLTLEHDSNNYEITTHTLIISNTPYELSFPISIEREDLITETMGIYYINTLKNVFKANLNKEFWKIKQTSNSIKIENKAKHNIIKAGIDGEVITLKSPLTISMLPKALKVFY
ncbi:diacylglycerol/lipid kinase family protein [Francisella frigiditurris]|uniref:Diacylglycerol kinase catalytic domain protein n=1 Tax=Francisella frigiditurris TaxID=1542390 RepID=A0A1J0KSR2_9GAMM|nr:diacylglycerol kinase family protein [Francisella frigiditurris]APC96668.1 diacylglycerol kinase catalytic domain protein [Francisella frigiditurris]